MNDITTDLVVIGGGPGGYASAFYAAEKGINVTLVDAGARLGGVCLNEGCIPSKALIHATQLMKQTQHAKEFGLKFAKAKVDLDQMRKKKDEIISSLAQGVASLAKAKKVTVIKGKAFFEATDLIRIESHEGQQNLRFKHAIIAVGSDASLPALFDLGSSRVMTSREALNLEEIPDQLLVIGGGYIGLELGMVYSNLGSKVSMVEASDALLGGFDKDLLRPINQSVKSQFKELFLKTTVQKMQTKGKKIELTFQSSEKTFSKSYDRVLVAVGRQAKSQNLGLEYAGIECDEKGFIKINDVQQSSVKNIYAIGDVVGGVMLAHKASKEAKIAVDSILGETVAPLSSFVIPCVVFTDPELAWAGVTEKEAKESGMSYKIAKFPWTASGKAMALDRTDGLTKVIYNPDTHRILGVGMVGVSAANLISEAVLAIDASLTLEDFAESIHPHPTLSETIMEASEQGLGFPIHSI